MEVHIKKLLNLMAGTNTYKALSGELNFFISGNSYEWMNEWMNARLSLFDRHVWMHGEGATLKHTAYNDIYSGNSLNVCIAYV